MFSKISNAAGQRVNRCSILKPEIELYFDGHKFVTDERCKITIGHGTPRLLCYSALMDDKEQVVIYLKGSRHNWHVESYDSWDNIKGQVFNNFQTLRA